MKRLIFLLSLFVALSVQAQFTYFSVSVVDQVADLSQEQKVEMLDYYANKKSVTAVKHDIGGTSSQIRTLYVLFRDVNSRTDALMLDTESTSYSGLLDVLEGEFEVPRSWLDAIVTKKVNYCTSRAVLEPLNNTQKWEKYLELLRQ